jgi:hypothetical protein
MRCAWIIVLSAVTVASSFASATDNTTAPSGGDGAWLQEKDTLIFEGSFDRDEDGNLAAAIGNGWNSATADRVPDEKQADLEWHQLVLVTQGDEMRVTLDGKPLGSHRSEGFAHPMKCWFSMLMNPSAWIDDVKVYKVK